MTDEMAQGKSEQGRQHAIDNNIPLIEIRKSKMTDFEYTLYLSDMDTIAKLLRAADHILKYSDITDGKFAPETMDAILIIRAAASNVARSALHV